MKKEFFIILLLILVGLMMWACSAYIAYDPEFTEVSDRDTGFTPAVRSSYITLAGYGAYIPSENSESEAYVTDNQQRVSERVEEMREGQEVYESEMNDGMDNVSEQISEALERWNETETETETDKK